MVHIRVFSVALAAVMISGIALAQDFAADAIKVTNVWTREVPPASKVASGYMTITNTGTQPDTLIGGSIAGASGFEVHQMETVGGEMKMRELKPGLVIPAGATIVLKPGSSHAMFVDLKTPPKRGQSIKGTLIFAKAGKIDVEYRVERLGARAPDDRGPVSTRGSGHEHH